MEIKEAVEALTALAQDSRLAVFRLLVRYGTEGLPAGKVAEILGVPPPTLSFHLTRLSHAGLIQSRREGRHVSYAADFARMNALLQYLTENCCAGGAYSPVRFQRKESPVSDRKRSRSSDPEQARLRPLATKPVYRDEPAAGGGRSRQAKERR